MSVVEGASPWRIKGAYSLVDSVGEGRPLYLFIPDLRLNFIRHPGVSTVLHPVRVGDGGMGGGGV